MLIQIIAALVILIVAIIVADRAPGEPLLKWCIVAIVGVVCIVWIARASGLAFP